MTDKLRDAAQAIVDRWDSPAWGGSAENLRHTGEYIAELRAALAQQDAQKVPPGYKLVPVEPTEAMCEEGLEDEGHTIRDGKAFADALYRAMLNAAPTPPAQDVTWKEYVETACALIKAADDAAADCDYMLDSDDCIKVLRGQWKAPLANDFPARPQPAPAQQPLGWLDRKAVECLQGAELNWMPAWNRPTSSDPVPIFLLPPAQRVMLTDEDIREWWVSENGLEDCDMTKLDDFTKVVRAVIEAYERKNGIK